MFIDLTRGGLQYNKDSKAEKKLSMVVHTYNPCTQESKAGGW
jgi:hypothetical protein